MSDKGTEASMGQRNDEQPRRASLRAVDIGSGQLVAGAQLWFERQFGQFFTRQDGEGDVPSADEMATVAVGFFLHMRADEVTVIDTGIGHPGSGMKAVADGALPVDALAFFDRRPADVDTVILTHLHVDHAGGILASDGSITFPRARHVVHRDEVRHWRTVDGRGADVARAALAALEDADLLDVVEGAANSVGPMRVMHTPGHTPGHLSVEIPDGEGTATVLGDIIHHASQLADPGIGVGADVDPATAVGTRREMLAHLADTGGVVGAGHLADHPLLRIAAGDGLAYVGSGVGTPVSGAS